VEKCVVAFILHLHFSVVVAVFTNAECVNKKFEQKGKLQYFENQKDKRDFFASRANKGQTKGKPRANKGQSAIR